MSARAVVIRCVLSVALVAAIVGMVRAATAPAAGCTATSTATLVTAVADANAASGASTITLCPGVYAPTATLDFTNTSGTITIQGSTTGQVKLTGSSVLPF